MQVYMLAIITKSGILLPAIIAHTCLCVQLEFLLTVIVCVLYSSLIILCSTVSTVHNVQSSMYNTYMYVCTLYYTCIMNPCVHVC